MKTRFRHISDLKGFNDNERDFSPSLVDDTQYEPIETLVGRMIRGEIVKPVGDISYEISAQDDLGKAFESQSVVEREDFDLSDSVSVLASANQALKDLKSSKSAEPVKADSSVEGSTDKK